MRAYFSWTIFVDENMPIYDFYHVEIKRQREKVKE